MDDGTPDTSWNGRRLPEAESYITEKLSSALQEANGWTTGTWGCTADELSELQVCVRGMYHLAWLRHEYLKKLPWRFCRVHEPGMAAKVIEQYDTHSQHDSVSHYFLSPDGPWRAHIEAITPDGGNISPELSRELRFFIAVPMDDSICETPHAVSNAIARSSKHCSFSWVASTMRLTSNISDVKTFSKALRVDIQDVWLRYASILQTDIKKQHVTPKMTRKDFTRRVYNMGLLSEPLRQCGGHAPELEQDDTPHAEERAAAPVADAPANDDDDDGEDDLIDAGPAHSKSELALMKEYLAASLKPGMYVSFPVRSDEQPDRVVPFFAQVLAIAPRVTLPKMCRSK